MKSETKLTKNHTEGLIYHAKIRLADARQHAIRAGLKQDYKANARWTARCIELTAFIERCYLSIPLDYDEMKLPSNY